MKLTLPELDEHLEWSWSKHNGFVQLNIIKPIIDKKGNRTNWHRLLVFHAIDIYEQTITQEVLNHIVVQMLDELRTFQNRNAIEARNLKTLEDTIGPSRSHAEGY